MRSGLEFDVCFNCPEVIQCTDIVFQTNDNYPELKYLLMVLKVFLMQRNMHDSEKGGVDSFLLFNMILAFLRDFKQQQIKKNSVESLNDVTLSEYLMKFLSFYGNFDYKKKSIYMKKPEIVVK